MVKWRKFDNMDEIKHMYEDESQQWNILKQVKHCEWMEFMTNSMDSDLLINIHALIW
jgi:hypothetical protein